MEQWYYGNAAGRVFGPMNENQMRALAANGTLQPSTPVRRADAAEWTTASAAGFTAAGPAPACGSGPAPAGGPAPSARRWVPGAVANFDSGKAGAAAAAAVGAGAADFADLMKGSIVLSLPNLLSILGALVLWLLTIWIPYVNVGTTIAILTLPRRLAEDGILNPLCIFETRYRKYMGDFFLMTGIMGIALAPAFFFLLVPGIVLSLSWCLAYSIVLDDDTTATQALSRSNELMSGHKWAAFFAFFLISLAGTIVSTVLGLALGAASGTLAAIVALVVWLLQGAVSLGVVATLYRKLVLKKTI